MRSVPPAARLTRSYARVWSALPYVRQQVIGAGCYAVNAAGRRRWPRFPAIISDDKFVRLHFASQAFLAGRHDLWLAAPLFAMTFFAGNFVAWRERHAGPAAWAVATSAPSRSGAPQFTSSPAR